MRLIAFSMLLLLAACASTPELRSGSTVTEAQTVVRERCIDPQQVPAPPQPYAVKPDMNHEQKTAAAAAELLEWRVYGGRASVLFQSCMRDDR